MEQSLEDKLLTREPAGHTGGMSSHKDETRLILYIVRGHLLVYGHFLLLLLTLFGGVSKAHCRVLFNNQSQRQEH